MTVYTVNDDSKCFSCLQSGQDVPATTSMIAKSGDYGYFPWQNHSAYYECPLCDECAKNHSEPIRDN